MNELFVLVCLCYTQPNYWLGENLLDALTYKGMSYVESDPNSNVTVILREWQNGLGITNYTIYIKNDECDTQPMFSDGLFWWGIEIGRNKPRAYYHISLLRYHGYRVKWEQEALYYFLYEVKP